MMIRNQYFMYPRYTVTYLSGNTFCCAKGNSTCIHISIISLIVMGGVFKSYLSKEYIMMQEFIILGTCLLEISVLMIERVMSIKSSTTYLVHG